MNARHVTLGHGWLKFNVRGTASSIQIGSSLLVGPSDDSNALEVAQ